MKLSHMNILICMTKNLDGKCGIGLVMKLPTSGNWSAYCWPDCFHLYIGCDAIDPVRPMRPGLTFGGTLHVVACLQRQPAGILCEVSKLVAKSDDELTVNAPSMACQAIVGDNFHTVFVNMRGQSIWQSRVTAFALR